MPLIVSFRDFHYFTVAMFTKVKYLNREVFDELISQRLAQNFQLIVNQKVKKFNYFFYKLNTKYLVIYRIVI